MPTKQGTLGYVPSGQQSLRKFLGNSDRIASVPTQSRLSFKSKTAEQATTASLTAKPVKSEVETKHTATNEPTKAAVTNDSSVTQNPKTASNSPSSSPSRKRVKKEVIDVDNEDEGPIRKRTKRTTGEHSGTARKQSVSPTPSPSKSKTQIKKELGVDPTKATEKAAQDVLSEIEDQSSEVDGEAQDALIKAKAVALSAVSSSTKDHYPDWVVGESVSYAALCTTFSKIEMTTKRLEMISHCSLFLRQVLRLSPQDLLPIIQLMTNKLAPDWAGIELGIGESLILKAIGESTGRSLSVIKADQNEIGDLGLVAVKSRLNQPTMFKPKPLTVKAVFDGLMTIATTSGDGSQALKVSGIKKLLSSADASIAGKGSKAIDITKDKGGPSETKFIIRFLEGKLRLGLADKTVLVALARAFVYHEHDGPGSEPSASAFEKGESILRSVYSELPSYEVIIPAIFKSGLGRLRETCCLRPGVPLKPMLAKPTKSITEVLDRFEGKTFTCEYKYDGERAQIHYVAPDSPVQYSSALPGSVSDKKGLTAIFSRNSEDLSKKYPDILAKLKTWIRPETKSFVLDCETVAWDVDEKKVLPFQQLMTRKRKDVKVEDVKVKVCVFAFDMLFYNGEAYVERTLRERRAVLTQAFIPMEGEFALAQYGDTSDIDEIQILLDESVKASCEGLMVKMLDSAESSYQPSKRSQNWLKVKKDYLAGIGDSLDLVVLGAYYGKGKRTSVYGAFMLACYNSSTETYETVCNIGTGFSEAVLEQLHADLAPLVIERAKPFYARSGVPKDQPDVWLEPRFVFEVKTADLTLSPRYVAGKDHLGESIGKGISLRFPRFIRVRDDKAPEQATTSRQIVDMYYRQDVVAAKKAPAADDDFEY